MRRLGATYRLVEARPLAPWDRRIPARALATAAPANTRVGALRIGDLLRRTPPAPVAGLTAGQLRASRGKSFLRVCALLYRQSDNQTVPASASKGEGLTNRSAPRGGVSSQQGRTLHEGRRGLSRGSGRALRQKWRILLTAALSASYMASGTTGVDIR